MSTDIRKAGDCSSFWNTATNCAGRAAGTSRTHLDRLLDHALDHLRLRAPVRRQHVGPVLARQHDADEAGRERTGHDGEAAPAPHALRQIDDLGARPGSAGDAAGAGTSGSRIGSRRAPRRRRRPIRSQTGAGGSTGATSTLSSPRRRSQRRTPRRSSASTQQQRVGLRALVGIERAEHVFRRQPFPVFVHGHDPRHSRISSRLRRSQVLIVFAGASNFAASCSRLQPL